MPLTAIRFYSAMAAVNEQQKSQIKSKERVSERGEVFTAEREVNAMLDLVANECLRPDSRFLEPACGDGNFLSAILKRKLTESEVTKPVHTEEAEDLKVRLERIEAGDIVYHKKTKSRHRS